MMICKARSVTQVQNSVGEIIIIESSKHKNIGDHSEVTSRLSIHVRIHWGELLKQYKEVKLKFRQRAGHVLCTDLSWVEQMHVLQGPSYQRRGLQLP